MFFVLALSQDGGKTWVDDFHTRYETGAVAAAEAKRLNEYNKSCAERSWCSYRAEWRYRVRKVVDTDSDNFYAREAALNHSPIDFFDKFEEGYKHWMEEYYLPHWHPEKKHTVRFFASVENAIEGRYTEMSIRRFFFSHLGIDESEASEYLVKIGYYNGNISFGIARDPLLIEKIYAEGPNSCMADPDEFELPEPHPVRVYGSPDFGVAYLCRGEETYTARAVVCIPEKIYHSIYGHDNLLESKLKEAGFEYAKFADSRWIGKRLLKIYDGFDRETPLMPYLDFVSYVKEDDDYMVTSNNDEDYYARNTTGYVSNDYD